MPRTFAFVVLAGMAVSYPYPGRACAEPASSIDDQLLDDLKTDLFEGGETLPAKPSSAEPGKRPQPPLEELDRQLLEQLGDGEDVGLPSAGDPFLRIGQRMRMVQERIGQDDTSATTQQLQRRIVGELDELLEQLRKKQCGGGTSTQPSHQQRPQPPTQAGSQRPSQRPARDSTTRVGQADAQQSTPDQRRDLVTRAWGHLPAKVRQQLQNAQFERFLPKYEQLIEAYFKRLADEGTDRP